jgi:hypothetical protein
MVPPPDDVPWPTLGPYVCDWLEENLCHGPGDLLGQPLELNDEWKAWIYRMYEVEPPFLERRHNGVIVRDPNPDAGKRRFHRCALSLRKGSAKTEFAALVAAAELHPDGPVRCAGFDGTTPIPRGVMDPYIPMISYSEEQTEELAYGALRRILEKCAIGNDFDIGLERIIRLNGEGKAVALSASPNARDGARTTFQHADETHRFVLDTLKRGWKTMLANMAKRPIADPWALETTTAPEPGAGSVAEGTIEYARDIRAGKVKDAKLFFYHRQARESLDIQKPDELRQAVIEAAGPFVSKWSDTGRIVSQFHEPDADLEYLERVWLNRLVQSAAGAFDVDRWRELVSNQVVKDGTAITLGFDGSRYADATSLIGTDIYAGHQFVVGIWEKPANAGDSWEVLVNEVDAAVHAAFERWNVCRMYCDPPKWESWIAAWAGKYEKRVVEWWTNRIKPMAYSIRSYNAAIRAAELSHDGNKQFADHIANARKASTNFVDDEGRPLWILRKERPDSPKKIDAAMAGCLSWEARNDAVAAGEGHAASYDLLFV